MQIGDTGSENVQAEGCQSEPQEQREGGPDEEQRRRGVVVAAVRQRLAIPLVPLVAEPTVHVDVDQLRAGGVRHTGQDSYLLPMLPPPPIRGIFRTDHRARAAYAEAAGIFRILPAAVCVPIDREDLA